MKEITTVVFRVAKDGEVCALFPFELGQVRNPGTCSCYVHVGQHSWADVGYVNKTKPATRKQYLPLLKELRRIGYKNIRVLKRIPRTAWAVRSEQCR